MNEKFPIILGALFCFAAVLLLSHSFSKFMHAYTFLKGAEETEGTIIGIKNLELEGETRNELRSMYAPIYSFTPKGSDREVRVEERQSSRIIEFGKAKCPFEIGQKVRVLYSRENPTNAKIKSFLYLWFAPLASGILGILSLVVGLAVLITISKET